MEGKSKEFTREGLQVFLLEYFIVGGIFNFKYEINFPNLSKLKNEYESLRLMEGLVEILRCWRGNMPEELLSPLEDEDNKKINYSEEFSLVIIDETKMNNAIEMYVALLEMVEGLFNAESFK